TNGHFAVTDLDTSPRLTQPKHQHQNLLLAEKRHIIVGVNIIHSRSLRKTSEERGFCECELIRGFAEVSLGSGFDSIRKIAIVNFIEIELKDFMLGISTRNFSREDDLTRFAPVGSFSAFLRREQKRARQLLRDRGCAAALSVCAIVFP